MAQKTLSVKSSTQKSKPIMPPIKITSRWRIPPLKKGVPRSEARIKLLFCATL